MSATAIEISSYPAYVVRDDYQGKWTVPGRGRRSDVFTAAELAAQAGRDANGFVIIWESFGHVGGVVHYSRSRCLTRPDGSLVVYSQTGSAVIHHPADRKIRVMTR